MRVKWLYSIVKCFTTYRTWHAGHHDCPSLLVAIYLSWSVHSHFVVWEIMHAAAQSMHEYVWHVKWDQGERNGWLQGLNSHPPDRELYLMSGLPTHCRACKLPHCVIDQDVAFWYDYLSPAWMHWGKRGILSLGDTWQEFSAWKFRCPPSIKKMTQQQYLKLIPRVQ